jgi:hypothetical protein
MKACEGMQVQRVVSCARTPFIPSSFTGPYCTSEASGKPRCSVVGCGTVLDAEKSRGSIPVEGIDFFFFLSFFLSFFFFFFFL